MHLREDLPLFAETSLKIIPKDGGTPIPFEMNRAQLYVHDRIEKQLRETGMVRAIVLKGRQQGISTYSAARFYQKTSMQPGRRASIIAHEQKASTNLFNLVKRYHDNNPIKPHTGASNEKSLIFDRIDSGYSVMTAGADDVGRSNTFQLGHFSEFAFWPNAAMHMAGLGQTIADLPGTEIIVESTANGVGNSFHQIWQKAESGENGYIAIFVPWYWQEEYRAPVPDGFAPSNEEITLKDTYGLDDQQLVWRRKKIASFEKGKEWLFRQEYPMCIAAGERVGTQRGLIPIEDVLPGDVCHSGLVSIAKKTGVKQVFKITTSLGYSVVATADHRIKIDDDEDGFVEAASSVGQRIKLAAPLLAEKEFSATWRPLPSVESSIRITPDIGRLFGYFMGDGSYHETTLSIVNNARDTGVIEDVERLIESFVGRPAQRRTTGTKKGCIEVRIGCAYLKEVFGSLGMISRGDKVKRVVCVPEAIFRSPKPVVKEFLRGLFEADGFSDYACARIVLFSKYRKFLEDVQRLLLAFGITSRLSTSKRRTGDHSYIANDLVLRADEARAFAAQIGFVSEHKQSRCNKWIESKNIGRKPGQMVLADEVVSVEEVGEADVYDLTVPESSRFDASGIVVHNCPAEAFISATEDPYINPDLVMSAVNSGYLDKAGPLIIGVDPAEFGPDRTVICFRRGRVAPRFECYKGKDTMEVAGIVANIINKHDPDAVFVDAVGIGAGVRDRLRELGFDRVFGVKSGMTATDDDQYANKRAEMWGRLREWLEDSPARLPNEPELLSDLSSPKYLFDSKGRLLIEKKADMKKRGIRSPDYADALCLTFAEPVAIRSMSHIQGPGARSYSPASSVGY